MMFSIYEIELTQSISILFILYDYFSPSQCSGLCLLQFHSKATSPWPVQTCNYFLRQNVVTLALALSSHLRLLFEDP